ncbi:MAG TPA: fumarylacetoacetate hydrolase family protein [Vicinamibacteria bacterium]|jgi:2-keto-4-pentenoate hydratase/2-oxohepta-3-ene-1,7-dioic acid hydratase in catechol pathway
MKLVSYHLDGKSYAGVVVADNRLCRLGGSLREVLSAGEEGLERARAIVSEGKSDHALDEVELLPVIPDPPAIWCVGVNYDDHLRETGREPTKFPTLFLRIAASQVGHGQPMVRPKASVELDFEGELAVVLGKTGRHIAESEAMNYVAGYSCYNDGSVRDWQRHTTQFGPGKNFHRTGAFGPWLVTKDELPDPYAQTLSTRVSGEEMQRTRISAMTFKIEFLIHYLSTVYELRPGDVISTGTPGGVGSKRKPPRFLRAGDRVEVEISGVGRLSNPIVDES